jgi:hypothetical protein
MAMALPTTGLTLRTADDRDAGYSENFGKYVCLLYISVNMLMYVICFDYSAVHAYILMSI